VLRGDGSLDRAKLRRSSSPTTRRAKLNAIVHPLVREHMRAAEQAAIQAAGRDA
jgi:dephospho-CoA kinase